MLPFIVSGFGFGAVYALSGIGLVVLFRSSGVLNFAFGALGAIAAHTMWSLMAFGLPLLMSAMLAVAVGTAISSIYGLAIASRLSQRNTVEKSLATLGLALILLGAMGLIWGEVPRRLPLPTDTMAITLFGTRLTGTRIFALLTVLSTVICVDLLLKKTRLGLAMRAVAINRDLSQILGLPAARTDLVAWLMSGILASMSGIFLANLVRLQPTFLTFLVIPAVATALLGGLVSLRAAAIGGVALGVIEACFAAWPDVAPYRTVVPYVIALAAVAAFGRHIERLVR